MTAFRKKALSQAVVLGIAATLSQQAMAFDFQKGNWSGSWDTTISYGASWRVEDRDPNLVGKANLNPAVALMTNEQQRAAPGRWSINSDNGNLAYDDGDLISNALKITSELGFSNDNGFGGFFRVSGFYDSEYESRDDELNEDALDLVGSDIRLLDAYLFKDFEIGEKYGTVRVGRQVVSWGESTFITNGINIINAADVSKLRLAGSELKEVFLPQEMVWGSIDLTYNLSMEALYMLEFEEVEPDPAGTYYGTNDFATPGAEYVMLGFGTVPELTPGATIFRGPDNTPSDGGQFGIGFRYFAENLNNTEFGLFYVNYHSRLPLISGTSVTSSDLTTGSYFVEYPEDIQMTGLSWNTTLGTWAWSGEMSYRDNMPLQIDDVEVLFAALTPLNTALPAPGNRFYSQLGNFGPGEYIRGWERHEVSQFQTTFTKLIGPNNFVGADQIAFVTELGATKVWDLPELGVLRYNGPGTDTGGGPDVNTGQLRNPVTQETGFPDSFSWGYRMLARADYNNAFGTSITLQPRIAFNHDANGTTPGPGGNFIEDRKQLTLGLGWNYLNKWAGDVSYTRYFGAGIHNLLSDRDFVSIDIKYSF